MTDVSRKLLDRDDLRVTYHYHSRRPFGRFGGGWQWKVGIQATGSLRCVIISLLVASVRIDRGP